VTLSPDLYARAQAIRLLLLDVDGVLTDGRLYYAASGEELKAFHIRDGLGLKLLRGSGVEVAIVTGRKSRALELRAENLGLPHVFQGVTDKLAVFEQLLARFALQAAAVAAIGDDLPDLPVLRRCGFAACVPEASGPVRGHAHYVTDCAGGSGAVREVCDLLMTAQGTLEGAMREYLK
jgi:3-deoxy-D-manno-octulosonate 8-phosphate phosphatase (KDO 8-P phosphatase)